jgi:hypothetical protein
VVGVVVGWFEVCASDRCCVFFGVSLLLSFSSSLGGSKLALALLLSQRSKSPKDRNRATVLFEEVLSKDDGNCQALLGLAQHLDFTGLGAPRYVEDLYSRAISKVDALHRAAPRPHMPLVLKTWEPRLGTTWLVGVGGLLLVDCCWLIVIHGVNVVHGWTNFCCSSS